VIKDSFLLIILEDLNLPFIENNFCRKKEFSGEFMNCIIKFFDNSVKHYIKNKLVLYKSYTISRF